MDLKDRLKLGSGKAESSLGDLGFEREQAVLQKYQKIFDSKPALLAFSSADEHKLLDVNKTFVQVLGYDKKDLVGKSNSELALFVDPAEQQEIDQELYDKGFVENREVRLRTRDNGILHALLSADAMDIQGQKAFVTVAQDITKLKSYEQDLSWRLRIEKLVSRFASRLISASADSLDEVMNDILGELAQEVEADRAYFFAVDYHRGVINNTHEWSHSGIEPQLGYLQEVKIDSLPWWMERLQQDQYIYIEDVAQLPREAKIEKTVLQKHSIQSCVVVAITQQGQICGFLGFDSVKHRRSWSESDIALLSVVADIISAARLRVHMEKKLLGQREELIDKNRRLQEAVIRDSLTGLFNHGHIHDLLQREMDLAARYNRPLTIIMVDLDYFKSINDDYGHKAGDMILMGLANMMLHLFRETDLLGRYGGEEFVIILPETDERKALVAAERLRSRIANVNFPGIDSRVTLSAGVASYRQQSITNFINEADERLYRAKSLGRNRIAN